MGMTQVIPIFVGPLYAFAFMPSTAPVRMFNFKWLVSSGLSSRHSPRFSNGMLNASISPLSPLSTQVGNILDHENTLRHPLAHGGFRAGLFGHLEPHRSEHRHGLVLCRPWFHHPDFNPASTETPSRCGREKINHFCQPDPKAGSLMLPAFFLTRSEKPGFTSKPFLPSSRTKNDYSYEQNLSDS